VFPLLLGVLTRDSIPILTIYLLTYRFPEIGGWDIMQLLFLYCLLYFSYGLSMLFFAGIRWVEDDIRLGVFDRYMVTPLNVFFQAVVAKVDLLTTLSYCFLGAVIFVYSSNVLGIVWSLHNIFLLIVSLIGGMLIQSSLLLFLSTLSFWTIRTGQAKFVLFFNVRRLAIYPINIYPDFIRIILMYVFPFAFVNYFPAKAILSVRDTVGMNDFFAYGSIVIGLICFALVLVFWRVGLKNYKSTGN